MAGPRYLGVLAADNAGTGQVTVPADVETLAPQRAFSLFVTRNEAIAR